MEEKEYFDELKEDLCNQNLDDLTDKLKVGDTPEKELKH